MKSTQCLVLRPATEVNCRGHESQVFRSDLQEQAVFLALPVGWAVFPLTLWRVISLDFGNFIAHTN